VKHESDSSSGSWISEHSFPLKDPEPAFDIPEYEEAVGNDYDGYDKYIREEGMIGMSF
jgi:hypothetical protein